MMIYSHFYRQALLYFFIVFVGRINENTKPDELRDFFTAEARLIDPMSEVTDVFIPRPFQAFAFVEFTSPDIAQKIIRFDYKN
jgi:RNA recognition motif-containing protein